MNLTIQKVVALIITCGLCSGLGGYYAASFSPVQGQIAIVDVQALLTKAIAKNQAQTEGDAKALTAKIKAATVPLVEQGIVILDSQSVLSAPEDAYVKVE
jgi:NADH:ubiquinone oxidoreductase subunit B-like Fe-S oxidoreductase